MNKINLENTIIYLLGFPGVGKYSIAKKLVEKTNIKLVDNHLINNPVFSLIETDGKTALPKEIWVVISKIWSAVLDTIENISPKEYSFVLTNSLCDGDEDDLNHYNNIEALSKKRKAKFIPVRLMISNAEEHVKRITSSERKDRFKEINPEAPYKYMNEKEIIKVEHKNVLTLDVADLNIDQAADIILEHIEKTL